MEYVELQPGSGNRRRRAVLASFALLLGGAMLWSRPSPTSPRVAAPELGAARQSRSRAGLSDSSWSDYAALLNESSGSIHISTDYAQCWTGYCTLNGDGLTASCGCLSVRPSADISAKLAMGWLSAVLIKSSYFRQALRYQNDGDTSSAEALMDAALTNGSLWNDYDFSSTPSRISLLSSATPYFTAGATECTDVYYAQCLGAPCWDVEYPAAFGTSYWNVTCICPYYSISQTVATETHSTVCTDAAQSRDECALVTGGSETVYSASNLERMVEAVEYTDMKILSDTCPVYYEER